MFENECLPTPSAPNINPKKKVDYKLRHVGIKLMKKITLVYHCCKCEKKITTYWNGPGVNVEGDFISLENEWSELFEMWIPIANMVQCKMCTVFPNRVA